MSNKNSPIGKIILFSVIFLAVGGVAGYFIGEHSFKGNFRGENPNFYNNNFQINDTVKSEIISFFENSPTSDEINAYCQNNPRYCMEYCRTINASDTRCEELTAGFRGGMPSQ